MHLDLNPTGFNSSAFGRTQEESLNIFKDNSKAVIYVIKPFRGQFGKVGLRPFLYNFDENFTSRTQEILELTNKGTANHSAAVSDLMSRHNLGDHLMPNTFADMCFNGEHLDHSYRFILIFTQDGSSMSNGDTLFNSGNNTVRRIYTGYFVDEPFNPATFGSHRHTPNPNAYMIITHKTIVGTRTEHWAGGSLTKLNTSASETIVHPEVTRNLTSYITTNQFTDDIHLMTPENCINTVETSEEGFSYTTPGVGMGKDADSISDIFEQPTHNVGQIVKGLIRFQDNNNSKREMTMYRNDRLFDDQWLDQTMTRSQLGRAMALPPRTKTGKLDLDINARLSLLDIDTLVNHDLDVVSVGFGSDGMMDSVDQMESSFSNQFSFLIASVISPILNAAGLTMIQFEYQIMNRNGRPEDNVRIMDAITDWPVGDDERVRKANAVMYELSNGVFKTIFESMGDFHLIVHASATSTTSVQLSLVGQGHRCFAPFMYPSSLGGLISPLIGNTSANVTNASAIVELYAAVSGTETSTIFNDDDNAFMSMANKYLGFSDTDTNDTFFPD